MVKVMVVHFNGGTGSMLVPNMSLPGGTSRVAPEVVGVVFSCYNGSLMIKTFSTG